jgi:hypothetical protein
VEGGRFSRPYGPGALSRAISENQYAAWPPFNMCQLSPVRHRLLQLAKQPTTWTHCEHSSGRQACPMCLMGRLLAAERAGGEEGDGRAGGAAAEGAG